MNRSLFFLILTTALTGLGCAPKAAPLSANACDWLPRGVVAEVTQLPVTLTERTTLPGGEPGCNYYTGEREQILQVVADTRTVDQTVTELRNAYPTDRQPALTFLSGVGQSAVFVSLDEVSAMIYATSGTRGFLLTNTGDERIGRDELIELAKRVFISQ